MKYYILTFILTTISWVLFGQSNDTWTAFWNRDTSLMGYKDKNGVAKMEPGFRSLANKTITITK